VAGLGAAGAVASGAATAALCGTLAAAVLTAGDFTNCFATGALATAVLAGAAFFAASALLTAIFADARAAFAAASASRLGTALTAVASWPAFDFMDAATAGSIFGDVGGFARLTGAMIGSIRCAVVGGTAAGSADGAVPAVWAVTALENGLNTKQAIIATVARGLRKVRRDRAILGETVRMLAISFNHNAWPNRAGNNGQFRQLLDFLSNDISKT
jgi:hypothetical protein